MSEGTNHIATAADFRRLAEGDAFEPPVRLVLPKCGFAIRVRRPRPLAYTVVSHPIPQSLALRIEAAGSVETAQLTVEERARLAVAASEVLCAAIIEPQFSLDPSPDQIDPRWLPVEDREYLWKWVVGEVFPEGGDNLASFRPQAGPSTDRSSG